jgi:hypothetical protein
MDRIAVIGDRHGYDFKIDPDEYTHVVFLGDYVDSFVNDFDKQYAVLQKAILLRKKFRNVTLLIGNHDYQYFNLGMQYRCSGFQGDKYMALHAAFVDNWNCFDFCFQHKNYIFTHAGISATFLDAIRERTGLFFDLYDFGTMYNEEAAKMRETFFVSSFNGGHDPFDGPLWIRPEQLMLDLPSERIFQVVGHTHTSQIPEEYLRQNTVKFCDNEVSGNSITELIIL